MSKESSTAQPTRLSIAITGSGGSGAVISGSILLAAVDRAGFYGLMTRSAGPQIRGGESAAMVRFGPSPVTCLDDRFDILVGLDWHNIGRFLDEIPLDGRSLVLTDPAEGAVPPEILATGALILELPLKTLAAAIPGGRLNMAALGAVGAIAGLPREALEAEARVALGKKGESLAAAAVACIHAGYAAAPARAIATGATGERWNLSGNEASGLGALRGGVRFVAAYPITPATELLEWMAPALTRVGGTLLQAEDELASVNMIIGASYGGVPSLTATAGPGLALMTEGIGLAVAAEVPIVVVDVMRGGPSTGIPAKSEQSDLSFAVDGLHGDAPRLVVAPNSIADCLAATEWAVQLAETLQAPAIVLSDQFMGQSRAVIDRPAQAGVAATRLTASAADTVDAPAYQRYLDTASGISPMAVPGTPGTVYTADGLEHSERGIPSSQSADHRKQLDKRQRKLDRHDYGPQWADVEGDADLAVITFGSTTGAVREAVARAAVQGVALRLLSLRLLAPLRTESLAEALRGVRQVLVVEQNHGGQLLRYLRSRADLPGRASGLHRPGPLPLRPGELCAAFVDWVAAHAPQEATA